jgi:O-methyltransferase
MNAIRLAKLQVIRQQLARVAHLPGVICEFGVFKGAVIAALALDCPLKACYGFDTFAGMPADKCLPHDGHKPGDFGTAIFERVVAAMPKNVSLIRGTFPESTAGVEVEQVCFAHVDFDIELSMAAAIAWLMPRMVPGGMMVFDDWNKPAMPGVDIAIAKAALKVERLSKHQGLWVKR